ncbi:MAG TPA: RICIN domain-containing protein [Tenuifilaceae bacterium]|mgnify:CR=1 FL=1|nr:RICIN domain-containing protein [Tenuifilaceae bacterium]
MKTFLNSAFALFLLALTGTLYAQPITKLPDYQWYHIQSAMNYGRNNGGYWDIPGNAVRSESGNNIQVWDLDGGGDRLFCPTSPDAKGYYNIIVQNNPHLNVDVAGGKAKNGTNVGLWNANPGENQRFLFRHMGNGRFKIYDKNGKVITLANRSSDNGSNVQIWDDQDGVWTEWYLINNKTNKAFIPTETFQVAETPLKGDAVIQEKNFWIQSAMDYGRDNGGCWDIPGDQTSFKEGANIQVWAIDGGTDRLFRFKKKPNSEYYQIIGGNSSNGVVDIAGGKTNNGTNVQIWTANNGSAQDFYLKHLGDGRFKIYHRSGKIVDLASRSNANGSNVHLWDDHDGIFNEWYLVDPTTRKAYIPDGKVSNKHTSTPEMKSDLDQDVVSKMKNLIETKQTTSISEYLERISINKLVQEDNGDVIVNAMSELESNDQVNMCVYMMNGTVKNKNVEVRRYVYTKLANVSYKKPSFLFKTLLNKHFADFKETDPGLNFIVSNIHNKINNAK